MNNSVSDNPPTQATHWPRQIKYIVGNEACERFSYYGIRSIMAGYITSQVVAGGLGLAKDRATEIIHLFVFANYFMPLLGAWLSDKIIGRYHTILWVSMVYCLGNGVLACSSFASDVHGKMLYLCTGLALIAFGSGGIKPCVSAFMGDQFKPEQSHLLQKAYGAFYWAINFGSFFSFLVIPWVKDRYDYAVAFGVPGILMALATLIFWLGTKYYIRVPTNRELKHAGFFAVFWHAYCARTQQFKFTALLNLFTALGLPALAMLLMTVLGFSGRSGASAKCLGWTAMGCIGVWYLLVIVLSLLRKTGLPEQFWAQAAGRYSEKEIAGARSFSPILFIFAFVPIFWTLFDQTNSTWVLQGQQMVAVKILGLNIGAEQMQSMNPLIVMFLVPLFTLLIYPHIGRFASPLKRMSFGMFLAGAAYLVVAALQKQIESGASLCVLWQTVPYLILTAAEVLFSTTGLEFAFREAAPEMKSTIASFWLLTTAMGDLFVVTVTKLLATAGNHAASVSTGRFLQYAGMTFVVAVLFSLVAAFYQYHDAAAAKGK
jgi:POT family proton-dependent oligopeptide transporter